MREYTATTSIHIEAEDNLLRPMIRRAAAGPERPLVATRAGDGFRWITRSQFVDRFRAVARGLVALGVEPGDRVALMAHTRVEWLEMDFGIMAAGAVTVPIYDTSSQEQVRWILTDSESVVAVFETAELERLTADFRDDLASCRETFVIEEDGVDRIIEAGRDVDDARIDERIDALTSADLATIIYTSGTTGRPKGCMLTHGNLRANVEQVGERYSHMVSDDDVALLFLPLAHSLAKIVALFGLQAFQVAIATDMDHLTEELPMVQPTLITSVPRVFEKIHQGALNKAKSEGKGAIFERAAAVATRFSEQEHAGRVGLSTRIQHALFDALVYRKLRAAMGGRLRFASSGGGPLGARLTHFFNGVGVKILEGYGLTETSPVLSINAEGAWRVGTTGRPVASTTIRIAEDGEVLAMGPQVFSGYWRNQAATDEIIDSDGWFHTGDIGELDDDGYLSITGRKKDLIVTAAGKNVAPAVLEDALRAHPLISEAMVVGEGRPFIGALIAIDEDAFATWTVEAGHFKASVADLVAAPDLRAEIQRAVDDANQMVSRAESIRRFVILPQDLSIAGGELTPTLKVRRNVLVKHYGEEVEQIYSS